MTKLKKIQTLFFVCLFYNLSFSQTTTVQVLSAVEKDKKIEGAEILLQRNGENSIRKISQSNGEAIINNSFADDNNTLLIIKKEGYSNLVVKCPCNNLTYAISPVMKNIDGMRIVLNWGTNPLDLDSHLKYPNNHIFFEHKSGDNANLDVDDTDSYGPETITIDNKKFGSVYQYFVHDYSNKESMNDTQLSKSGAKVFVYVGQSLVKTYYIPQNKVGNTWNLFRINANGEIEDINTISSLSEQEVGLSGEYNSENYVSETYSISESDKNRAKAINKKGDLEYQKGNLDSAIRYYKDAIDIYPNFGQAYGNLGLLYAKKGMTAEAIYANRKAIYYTSSNATKAGAYYNNARLFEKSGEYREALNYYKLAKQNKESSVYDNAIARVKALIR